MKLHGCITRGNLILTRPEFIDLELDQACGEFIRAQFISNTFLFIGHSLSDDDTKRCLERLGGGSSSNGVRHYCLIRRNTNHPIIKKSMSDLYGVEFLEYEDHQDIVPFLKEFIRLVYAKKLSDTLKRAVPALGWILKQTVNVDGEEILLCKQIKGNDTATIALVAVPGDASEQVMAKAYAAATQCEQDKTLVVAMRRES
jgi:hypothetical protein